MRRPTFNQTVAITLTAGAAWTAVFAYLAHVLRHLEIDLTELTDDEDTP